MIMVPAGAAMLFLLAAQASPAPPAAPDPEYYLCIVNKSGPGSGGITYWLSVPVDGGPYHHRVTWIVLRQPGGLHLQADWSDRTPLPGGRMADWAWYSANFYLDRRVRGEARIEIRRRDDRHYPSEFTFAGLFQRSAPMPGGSSFGSQGRWADLRAWLAGAGHVTFALVDRSGAVLAQQRLDAALVDAGAAAIETARAEAEAMGRDYRNRCEIPEPIVVTSQPR
jgi:hypothetical protein